MGLLPGASTVNPSTFVELCPPGLVIVRLYLPGDTPARGNVAVNRVDEKFDVDPGMVVLLFARLTVHPAMNLLPEIVTETELVFSPDDGVIIVITGSGLFTVKASVTVADEPSVFCMVRL